MSKYDQDRSDESILSEYLDSIYKEKQRNFERVVDVRLQHLGIDIIFKNDFNEVKVDEKAQLHYLNKNLPTFALEIDYIKDGLVKEGWLFDTKKITEYYCFIFSIYLKEGVKTLTSSKDILSADPLFVNRLSLIINLGNFGLAKTECKKNSKALRENSELTKIDYSPGFNFQISRHLSEQPVNLVVKKSFLESIGNKL